MFKFSVCLTESPVSKGLPLKIYRQLKVERSMIMCYNPQMSCDAIKKHNYGLKLLSASEGNQTSWRDRNDRFHTFKMDAKSEPERACAKRIRADQSLCCIVSFPGLIRTCNPQVFFFFLRKLVNTPLKLSSHSFSRMPSVVHRN